MPKEWQSGQNSECPDRQFTNQLSCSLVLSGRSVLATSSASEEHVKCPLSGCAWGWLDTLCMSASLHHDWQGLFTLFILPQNSSIGKSTYIWSCRLRRHQGLTPRHVWWNSLGATDAFGGGKQGPSHDSLSLSHVTSEWDENVASGSQLLGSGLPHHCLWRLSVCVCRACWHCAPRVFLHGGLPF